MAELKRLTPWKQPTSIFQRELKSFQAPFISPGMAEILRPIRGYERDLEAYGQEYYRINPQHQPEIDMVMAQARLAGVYFHDTVTVNNREPLYLTEGTRLLRTIAFLVDKMAWDQILDHHEQITTTSFLASYLEQPQPLAPAWGAAYLLHFSRTCFPSLFRNEPTLSLEEVALSEILFLYFKAALYFHLHIKPPITHPKEQSFRRLLRSFSELSQVAAEATKGFAKEVHVPVSRITMSIEMAEVWKELEHRG